MRPIPEFRFPRFARAPLAAIFLGALALGSSAPLVSAQVLPAFYRVVDVAANDVLNMRESPTASAPIIGSLGPRARQIEIVELSQDERWGLINHGERSGWVALRYMQRESASHWLDGEQPFQCFGTEPFWSLNIFLPASRAEFDGLDSGGFELVTDAGTLPSTQFPPTLAIPFSGAREGAAILRGEACNDGMSDRAFGISAQIFFRGDERGLSGCCLLAR